MPATPWAYADRTAASSSCVRPLAGVASTTGATTGLGGAATGVGSAPGPAPCLAPPPSLSSTKSWSSAIMRMAVGSSPAEDVGCASGAVAHSRKTHQREARFLNGRRGLPKPPPLSRTRAHTREICGLRAVDDGCTHKHAGGGGCRTPGLASSMGPPAVAGVGDVAGTTGGRGTSSLTGRAEVEPPPQARTPLAPASPSRWSCPCPSRDGERTMAMSVGAGDLGPAGEACAGGPSSPCAWGVAFKMAVGGQGAEGPGPHTSGCTAAPWTGL
jgi:hypothetical protein